MNIQSITYILGWVLNFEAVFLCLPIGCAVLYEEKQGLCFLLVMLICSLLGSVLTYKKPKHLTFYSREGFVTTALSWVLLSLFGCLPFVLTGEIPHFVDALFETVSGFTTTGASILPEVEFLSHCSQLWRCFTHWIGGMGVLVFLLAVLPMVGGSNMQLMKAESPGPSVGKLVPKVRYTAQILYIVYMVLTVIEFFLLLLGGMIPYEAICTAFGTAGTGGFGVRNDSFASFSPYLQWVVTIFMILFGVNFNVYFLLLMRRAKEALRCEEMRWYLGIILTAAIIICANTYDIALTLEHNFRNSAFQVASIITTTGFASVDFDVWPELSRMILVMLMFCGACAGSTGGGLKVSRFVIAGKSLYAYIGSFMHPRAVRKVKFEGKDVDETTLRAVALYFVAVVFVFLGSLLIVALENKDLITTFTAVTATFNNIGPGLNLVGPTCNFGHFNVLTKLTLIFDMLAGRLELFPMFMLFYPPLWRETFREYKRTRRKMERGDL